MSVSELEKRLAALMKSAQQGTASDYRTLLSEILPLVRGFCQKRIGYLGCTEDVVQEILMAIHKARNTYDSSRLFTPWLFAIARYTMIDHLRTSKKFTKHDLVEDRELEIAINKDNLGSTENEPDTEEGFIEVRKAIEDLEPMYRDVIQLTKIKGASTREAATQLGVSESVVKVRTHRALGMLKKKLRRVANE